MKNGNYALRLPASLKKYVEEISTEDGTTMNQFIVSAVAEKVSVLKTVAFFEERAKRGKAGTIDRLMSRGEGQPPQAGDEAWQDGIASLNELGGRRMQARIDFPEATLVIADQGIIEKIKSRMLERNPIPFPMEISLTDIREMIGAPGQLVSGSISFSRKDDVLFDIHEGARGFRLSSKELGPQSREAKLTWLRETLLLDH